MLQGNSSERCAYCHAILHIVWVHGHGRRAACGINTDECCRGENGTDCPPSPDDENG